MKKLAALLLALLAVLPSVLAEGEVEAIPSDSLRVVEDSLLLYEHLDTPMLSYAAIVENVSPATLWVHDAKLELSDAEGKLLTVDSSISVDPFTLEPGERAYLHSVGYPWGLEEAKSPVSHRVSFTLGQGSKTGWPRRPMPGSASFELIYSYFGNDFNYECVARVRNDSAGDVYNIGTVMLLRDKEGKLLAILGGEAYEAGVPAGGVMLLRDWVPAPLAAAMIRLKRRPATVECIAWTADGWPYGL